MDKDAKEARDKKIFELWLACWSIEDIATETGASKSDVDRVVSGFSQNGKSAVLGKSEVAAADHATDFDAPIYNIWKQQEKSNGASHFHPRAVHSPVATARAATRLAAGGSRGRFEGCENSAPPGAIFVDIPGGRRHRMKRGTGKQ